MPLLLFHCLLLVVVGRPRSLWELLGLFTGGAPTIESPFIVVLLAICWSVVCHSLLAWLLGWLLLDVHKISICHFTVHIWPWTMDADDDGVKQKEFRRQQMVGRKTKCWMCSRLVQTRQGRLTISKGYIMALWFMLERLFVYLHCLSRLK